MIISERLISSDSVKRRTGALIRMIQEEKVKKKGLWYAVTTGSKGVSLLFILSNYELQNRYYWTEDRRVLALAGSWPEACKIAASLVDEARAALERDSGKTGPFSGRDFWDFFARR